MADLKGSARILRGSRVELLSPFPEADLERAFEWVHASSPVTEHDDSPATADSYKFCFTMQFGIITYAVRLREADPPIGLLYFEPSGRRDGFLHIALSRAAWGRGVADEAAAICIHDSFDRLPELTRLSASMLECNRPARALASRMGFRLEATFRDMVVQNGIPRNVVLFGLTRREWRENSKAHGAEETTWES